MKTATRLREEVRHSNPTPRSLQMRPSAPQFVIRFLIMSTCVAQVPFRTRPDAQLGRSDPLPDRSGWSPARRRSPPQRAWQLNCVAQIVFSLSCKALCTMQTPVHTPADGHLSRQVARQHGLGCSTGLPRSPFRRDFGKGRASTRVIKSTAFAIVAQWDAETVAMSALPNE